ncbi:MAG: hypothetical protein M3327_14390 [Actinomycetota bacterium]|nr:hypothetical protein [Actinomycetota bacterium]
MVFLPLKRHLLRAKDLIDARYGDPLDVPSKCACAITASRSGFGTPFRFVLPSLASVNMVSISDSNSSAGRTSQRKRASSSPAFQNR